HQLELGRQPAALAVLIYQPAVGEGGLGILVERLHIGVGGGAVEVKVVFLDVFTVVAFGAGQAEEALFENRVLLIPQAEREAQVLAAVANAQQAVFAPAEGAAAGLVVGEVIPGRAAGA